MSIDDESAEKLRNLIKLTQDLSLQQEQLIEGARIQARLLWAAYEALVAEGFSPDQAILVIVHRGNLLGF